MYTVTKDAVGGEAGVSCVPVCNMQVALALPTVTPETVPSIG